MESSTSHIQPPSIYSAYDPRTLLNACEGWDLTSMVAIMAPILHVRLILITKFSSVAVSI